MVSITNTMSPLHLQNYAEITACDSDIHTESSNLQLPLSPTATNGDHSNMRANTTDNNGNGNDNGSDNGNGNANHESGESNANTNASTSKNGNRNCDDNGSTNSHANGHPRQSQPQSEAQTDKQTHDHARSQGKDYTYHPRLYSRDHFTTVANWNAIPFRPGWRMFKDWMVFRIIPTAVATYCMTNSLTCLCLAGAFFPSLSMAQGASGITNYRKVFGDSPNPKAPTHGVVRAIDRRQYRKNKKLRQQQKQQDQHEDRQKATDSGNDSKSPRASSMTSLNHHPGESTTTLTHGIIGEDKDDQKSTPLRLLVIGDSLACGVGQRKCATPVLPELVAKQLSKAMDGRPVLWTCHGGPGASAGWVVRELERGAFNHHHHNQQSASNASAASTTTSTLVTGTTATSVADTANTADAANAIEVNSSNREMETESTTSSNGSLDDDVSESERGDGAAGTNSISSSSSTDLPGDDHADPEADRIDKQTWTERLKEHRIHFDPQELSLFDVAIVMTGSNDLKSAFFPFLLTGEDAEFRRQAQERGGGYSVELNRLLASLDSNMRQRLGKFRKSVTTMSQRMRGVHHDDPSEARHGLALSQSPRNESLDTPTSIDHKSQEKPPKSIRFQSDNKAGSSTTATGESQPLLSSDMRSTEDTHSTNHSSVGAKTATSPQSANNGASNPNGANSSTSLAPIESTSATGNDQDGGGLQHASPRQPKKPSFPVIVLPGMPSRVLPAFNRSPLRWLAIPMVDIMDSHKRRLAAKHEGEVLFIDPPVVEDLMKFKHEDGPFWYDKQFEKTTLSLRDIKRRYARQLEKDMHAYFEEKKDTHHKSAERSILHSIVRWLGKPFSLFNEAQDHYPLFSLDGVHPNELGYEFWGRYIGYAIVREYKRQQEEYKNATESHQLVQK